jgi:hypothetical protein
MSKKLNIKEAPVAPEERNAWAGLAVGVVVLVGYVLALAARADGGPLTEVAYQPLLLGAIGLGVVAMVALVVGLAMVTGEAANVADERDREIQHLGTRVGQAFLVIAGLAAMGMAMAEWHPFWIAHTLALGFWLASALEGVARVSAYRWGVPPW